MIDKLKVDTGPARATSLIFTGTKWETTKSATTNESPKATQRAQLERTRRYIPKCRFEFYTPLMLNPTYSFPYEEQCKTVRVKG